MAGPAAHGWTSRDLNALITDWAGVGHWLPDAPHRPIGLVRAILAWHGVERLGERPAALEKAREAAELAAARARVAAQPMERAKLEQARAAGRAALGGAGHAAARAAAAAAAARRSAARRVVDDQAAEVARAARVAAARDRYRPG